MSSWCFYLWPCDWSSNGSEGLLCMIPSSNGLSGALHGKISRSGQFWPIPRSPQVFVDKAWKAAPQKWVPYGHRSSTCGNQGFLVSMFMKSGVSDYQSETFLFNQTHKFIHQRYLSMRIIFKFGQKFEILRGLWGIGVKHLTKWRLPRKMMIVMDNHSPYLWMMDVYLALNMPQS